ncbi:MAG: transcription initiation factor TFIIIB, Brf1 subunit/transcription initiation factor TFIIB [Candidatus Bathyarchaeota archaeon B24]|nr:MAG: transcription initiation factor TFIIIB, Brf1 subunit/transcription initiation factor TFIIB [Candidatus Bathyarchaeota archaeon B24]
MGVVNVKRGELEELATGKSSKPSPKTLDACPECGSSNIIMDYSKGELICGDCGLVISSHVMDRGPEWRAFTQEEREERTRVGIPISYSVHDKGLSTVITRVNRDAFGRELPLDTRLRMLRLRKWQIRSRVHSSIERNLSQAMAELDRLSDKLNIPPPVKERAALIYRKALDKGLVRGRSIAAIAAASLYAACRQTETPRTLKEVAEVSIISKKDIARCYRLLLKELDLRMPIADPVKCVSKIASKVGIGEKCQQIAIDILRKAQEVKAASGKDPMGLAAAALYIACTMEKERKTQKEIAEAANVTEVTIRNRYNGLKKALGLNF